MERPIVIKVKYGDTLRRFTSYVGENGRLELDMEKLRARVISLFNFVVDADVTLTYSDEDGDAVTLVGDDDLCDAVRQNLNPLRINVTVNTERGDRSNAGSSGNSTPLRSPEVQPPLPSFNNGVAEVLKSVPDPLRGPLSKLYLDVASKAVYSAPFLAELVESFSRAGQSFLKSDSRTQLGADLIQFGADISRQNGASQNPVSSAVATGPEVSRGSGHSPDVLPGAKHVEPASKNIEGLDIGNVSRGVGTYVFHTPASTDIQIPVSSTPVGSVNDLPVSPKDLGVENEKERKNKNRSNPSGRTVDFGAHTCSEDCLKSTYLDKLNDCPFSGLPLATDSTTRPSSHPLPHSFERGHDYSSNLPIFHRGVCCDGCGVHPITGPRFKSKVKEDYDLCRVCFVEMGNLADYIRMDRPASYGYPWPVKDLYNNMKLPGLRPPAPPHPLRGKMKSGLRPPVLPHHVRGKMKSSQFNWDSRFVLDVNVMDGTVMAPSTHFTKIWRMQNSGNIAWPFGVKLVWIGGDRLSEAVSVQLETHPDGVAAGMEVYVAVDMKAPELPGRYVSYWMMSSPSGLKFGQRVWAQIQVDASLDQPFSDNLRGWDLNLPPGSSELKGAESLDTKVGSLVDGSPSPSVPLNPVPLNPTAPESVEQAVSEQPIKDQDLNFPINDTLLVGCSVSDPVPPKVPSPVESPVGFAEVAPVLSPHEPSFVANALENSERANENNDIEETLLKELEEMGFKQVDLNKEVLRMNEFDLGQSVDDLCGISEWDPILEELNEMGFSDIEMNRQLLKKNNGSIKRVVMDLIAGEKINPKEKTQ